MAYLAARIADQDAVRIRRVHVYRGDAGDRQRRTCIQPRPGIAAIGAHPELAMIGPGIDTIAVRGSYCDCLNVSWIFGERLGQFYVSKMLLPGSGILIVAPEVVCTVVDRVGAVRVDHDGRDMADCIVPPVIKRLIGLPAIRGNVEAVVNARSGILVVVMDRIDSAGASISRQYDPPGVGRGGGDNAIVLRPSQHEVGIMRMEGGLIKERGRDRKSTRL